MALTLHTISDFDKALRITIRTAEGFETIPRNVGDHTLTYGYGYTLIRKGKNDRWAVYKFLEQDLKVVGVTLSATQINSLKLIAQNLTNGAVQEADRLIEQFKQSWNKDELTPAKGDDLFNVEMQHQKDDMQKILCGNLGSIEGIRVFNSLEGTREMVGLISMFYNAQAFLEKTYQQR